MEGQRQLIKINEEEEAAVKGRQLNMTLFQNSTVQKKRAECDLTAEADISSCDCGRVLCL
jgi:hypothetical protein